MLSLKTTHSQTNKLLKNLRLLDAGGKLTTNNGIKIPISTRECARLAPQRDLGTRSINIETLKIQVTNVGGISYKLDFGSALRDHFISTKPDIFALLETMKTNRNSVPELPGYSRKIKHGEVEDLGE